MRRADGAINLDFFKSLRRGLLFMSPVTLGGSADCTSSSLADRTVPVTVCHLTEAEIMQQGLPCEMKLHEYLEYFQARQDKTGGPYQELTIYLKDWHMVSEVGLFSSLRG